VVCGASCRLKRRGKQARARRALEPARYRDDERERKRRSRAKPRPASTAGGCGAQMGSGQGAGHAPGEASKQWKPPRKFIDLWDTLPDVSRAGLERELLKIAQQLWRKWRQDLAAEARGHAPGGISIP
jgi:hypothetical protein